MSLAKSQRGVEAETPVSRGLVLLLATGCGLAAANLYYAQPLIGPIGAALGLSQAAAGLIVTMSQVGYVLGLVFIVPLGDLVENRRLVVVVLGLCALALLAATVSTRPVPFLAAMLGVGLCSVVVQILIPLSAHLAPEAMRGQVVGMVTSGLMLGIMLARPVSSMIAHVASWQTVFALSTAAILVLAGVLSRSLPRRQPKPGLRYGALLASMLRLFLTTPILRRRAAYQFCLFGAFSLFWTTVPLHLASAVFGLSQAGIAWFSLAAVAGVVAAPLVGRLADRGGGRLATGLGIAAVIAAFLLSLCTTTGTARAIGILTLAAIVLDFGVAANLVTSQRALFSIGADSRARLNAAFMSIFFTGGALGSALGAWAYARGGWDLAAGIGIVPPVCALLLFATEFRRR